MNETELVFGDEARQAALKGMEIVNEAVSVTIGAAGRTILINRGGFPTYATKDGWTVARNISLKDQQKKCGSDLIQGAAAQTNGRSGDGTSATTVITYAIAKAGMKLLIAGASPTGLVSGIEYATKEVLTALDNLAKPIEDNEDIGNIARIALNDDKELSELIMEAIEKVGRDGVITCQKSREKESSLEYLEGMHLKVGPYLANFLNQATRECILNDAYVICYNGHLRNFMEIKKLLDAIAIQRQKGIVKSVLIFCREANYNPIRDLLTNKEKQILDNCLIRIPAMEDQDRIDILQDIALYTGGKVIDEYAGSLHNTNLENLGTAQKVVINKFSTMIFDGTGEKTDIEARVAVIREDMKEEPNPMTKEKLQARIARLTTGIAIVNVGAATDAELIEKKFRVDDALQSVNCAIESGIVPGGGVALLRAGQNIPFNRAGDSDIEYGIDILLEALYAPIRAILGNAGARTDVILDHIEKDGNPSLGYDVSCDVFCDLYEAGIVDALKVVKESLSNASSVASVLLKTQGLIIMEPEKDQK